MLKGKVIQSKKASFHFEKEVLVITFNPDSELHIEDAKEMFSTRMSFQKGKSVKVLAIAGNFWNVTHEARVFFAGNETSNLNIAMAIVTKSLTTRITANFFIKINQPQYPTKTFKTIKDARVWLNSIT